MKKSVQFNVQILEWKAGDERDETVETGLETAKCSFQLACKVSTHVIFRDNIRDLGRKMRSWGEERSCGKRG